MQQSLLTPITPITFMLHKVPSQIQAHCFLKDGKSNTKQLSVLTGMLLMHAENLIHQISYSERYIKQLGMLLLVG